jgi:hypothetical protein
MRHLKTFESMERLYWGIQRHEATQKIARMECVDFNQSYLPQLNQLFSKDWTCSMSSYKMSGNPKRIQTYTASKEESEANEYYDAFLSTVLTAYELEDEYFIVKVESGTYVKYPGDEDYHQMETDEWESDRSRVWKCDGVDGLIACIEENIVEKE